MPNEDNQKELNEVKPQENKSRLDELGQRVMPPPPEKQVSLDNGAIKGQRVPPPPPEPTTTSPSSPDQSKTPSTTPSPPPNNNSNTNDSD